MKISLVIPFFNPHPSHFDEMLQGLLLADWRGFSGIEIILINDGGAFSGQAAMAQFANTATPFTVQLIELAENQGVSCARNAGMAAASGDWIAFHDADDISLPQRFVQSAQFLQQHPEVIAVAGDMQVFDEENPLAAIRLFPLSHAEICTDMLFYCAMAQPALMLNRQLWLASGVHYTPKMDMAQDWDFVIRLAEHGKLANLGLPLVRYRQHQQQRSSGIQREHANRYVRQIWQGQLQRLGITVTPELLHTHGVLSPYWLWLLTDLDGAWALTESAVQQWSDALLAHNQSSHYVDAALLQQRICHIQRQWRAWQASGQASAKVTQLFA